MPCIIDRHKSKFETHRDGIKDESTKEILEQFPIWNARKRERMIPINSLMNNRELNQKNPVRYFDRGHTLVKCCSQISDGN